MTKDDGEYMPAESDGEEIENPINSNPNKKLPRRLGREKQKAQKAARRKQRKRK